MYYVEWHFWKCVILVFQLFIHVFNISRSWNISSDVCTPDTDMHSCSLAGGKSLTFVWSLFGIVCFIKHFKLSEILAFAMLFLCGKAIKGFEERRLDMTSSESNSLHPEIFLVSTENIVKHWCSYALHTNAFSTPKNNIWYLHIGK